ncbi:MAG: ATP-binding protein [Candidatus Eisenbacteria bacterium]|nr:ATP-binding protein [Candidatus Eisenbacteria bacterium]
MALKPWYKVVTPREDLREERPLDASEFAVHLDQVRDGTAPKVYRVPAEFFERTFLTKSLGGLASEVVRRLSAEQVETSAVFNLSTQFGGGKTHALTLLYHLARAGSDAHGWKGVSTIMAGARVKAVPKASTAVFVGTEFDSITGRGGSDGTPLRKTPWGEIAFQLGGAEAFKIVAEHERTMTAPGGDVIAKLLPKDQPTLILLDELMNFVSRSRKSGLGGQLHSFLQNLSEVARGRNNVVLAVSIPASELEMSGDDQSDFERFKKILDRLGKAVMMSAETETSEIIRRRLFEWEGLPPDAKATVREYADWLQEHRDQVPNWFPVDTAYEAIAATYPFHPVTLSVFERKWRALPRFQQTRGVLRLLALWVSRAYRDGYKGGEKDALITLGTGPLDDPLFRAAVFEQLGEQRLEAAVTTDVAGRPEAHALRLDKEGTDAVRKARLHRKVATTIFFESNGGQQRGEATLPEVRLAVGEPGIDLASVDQCLEALGDACYYLHGEKGRYRFEFKANLNKLLADRRASVDLARIDEAVRGAVSGEFAKGTIIERILFPDKTGDIPDRPVLVLAVMGPERVLAEPGTRSLLEAMSREHGQSSRVFKSGVLWSVGDDAGTLRDEARKLLAWEDIFGDRETLKLDEPQIKQIKENIAKSKTYLKEAVWQTYKNLFLLDDQNQLRRIDLGKIHSSAAASIMELILSRLRAEDLLTDAVSLNTLVRNWPPALPEWSTRALRDAFYASPKFPRISSPEVIKSTIARGTTDGSLAYASRRGDAYEPFLFKTPLGAADVEISEDTVVLRKEDAARILAAVEAGGPAKPTPVPPPGASPGGGASTSTVGSTPPAPPVSVRAISGFRWEGDVPWQKWNQFYGKVFSRFSQKGLKLRVVVDVIPTGGASEQEVHDTRAALKELGLSGEIEIRDSDAEGGRRS